FTRQEDAPGHDLVLLSYGFWTRRDGQDRGVLGRTIRLDRRPYTIVGVMPPDFEFPLRGPQHNGRRPDPGVPLAFTPGQLQGCGVRPDAASRPDGGRSLCALDRLRERCHTAPFTRCCAPEGNRGSQRARCYALSPVTPDADRKPFALPLRWRAGMGIRVLGQGRTARARTPRRPTSAPSFDGWPRFGPLSRSVLLVGDILLIGAGAPRVCQFFAGFSSGQWQERFTQPATSTATGSLRRG